jgi:hypothetical protein
MKSNKLQATGFGLVFCFILFILTTKAISAPNTYGITNTRHNLMTPWSVMSSINVFNKYGEVCVYCHTPHGGQNSNAPLWNRSLPTTGNYTPYSSTTMDASVGQPDGISLACLSCHDGTIAVDNIINTPGSGTNLTGSLWNNPGENHYALAQPGQTTSGTGRCLLCHFEGSGFAPDFAVAALTQNLSNQHPISMTYPIAPGGAIIGNGDPKFYAPTGSTATARWFEEAGGIAGRADDNEIKLYGDGAGGYKVQCASCHNPHGTRIGSTNNLYPTFLRKSNSSSDLCITCHIK